MKYYNNPKSLIKVILLYVLVAVSLPAVLSCSKTASIVGVWHNESYVQVFEFKNDGSCTLKTTNGIVNGIYVFNEKSGDGTLSIVGKTLGITVKGDVLKLVDDGGVQTDYQRGEMAIVMITPKPTLVTTVTPTPKPSLGMATAPHLFTLKPGLIIKPGDIFAHINSEIIGTWYCVQIPKTTVQYKMDGTFIVDSESGGLYYGTYTYNATLNKGTMIEGEAGSQEFTFDGVKNQIKFFYQNKNCTFIDKAP